MRYEVKNIIKFGMIYNIGIYDNQKKEFTAFEFDETEMHLAVSRCELMNLLN